MALSITESLVQRVAAELAEGGWRYNLRQLYYACCAEAETPPNNAGANGELGLGVLFVLVALILIALRPLLITFVSAGMLLIVLGVVHRFTARPQTGRVLAMSYADFERRFSNMELPGIVRQSAQRSVDVDGDGRLVVCDTAETAEVIRANAERAHVNSLQVTSADAVADSLAGRTVAALHDASPRGCALVAQLRDGGAVVVDCGLRPRDVDSATAQVLEGAPARLPRDLTSSLSDDEIAWLLSGRRVELATLPPAALMERVTAALNGADGH